MPSAFQKQRPFAYLPKVPSLLLTVEAYRSHYLEGQGHFESGLKTAMSHVITLLEGSLGLSK